MSEGYTGVRVLEVNPVLINKVYEQGYIFGDIDGRLKPFSQNEYIVLKDVTGNSSSAIVRYIDDKLCLLRDKQPRVGKIKPKNKEQIMALDALLDDKIKVVVLTGRAGTGKTLLTLAAAMQKKEEGIFDGIILTRSMSWVGKHGLGALPGDTDQKFTPYLQNYINNLTTLVGRSNEEEVMFDMQTQYNMKFVPIQLIRGASWAKRFIIADEVQVFGYDEMVALGTRVGEGSKIIIMGDLGQRDEKIARNHTGIYKFVNSDKAKASPLVASIELIKSERSDVASLFADIFER